MKNTEYHGKECGLEPAGPEWKTSDLSSNTGATGYVGYRAPET